VAALKAAGCERIFREKSSRGRWDRLNCNGLLDQLRDTARETNASSFSTQLIAGWLWRKVRKQAVRLRIVRHIGSSSQYSIPKFRHGDGGGADAQLAGLKLMLLNLLCPFGEAA